MNSKNNLILILVIIFNLSGCSATKETSAVKEKMAEQQAVISQIGMTQKEMSAKLKKLEKQLDEWNKIQPNVQRLVAIEAQLNTLISQLTTLAQEAQQQNRRTAKQHPQTTKKQYYMLQLASLNSTENLKKTWLTKQAQYPKLLTGLEVRYQHVKIKGKEYYRLKVGKFTSAKEANKVCQALIKQKANCLLVPYSGDQLDAL